MKYIDSYENTNATETHTRKERRGGSKNGHQTVEVFKKKHVKSITTDNGGEFAKHKLISKKLHTSVYFTDPLFFLAESLCLYIVTLQAQKNRNTNTNNRFIKRFRFMIQNNFSGIV